MFVFGQLPKPSTTSPKTRRFTTSRRLRRKTKRMTRRSTGTSLVLAVAAGIGRVQTVADTRMIAGIGTKVKAADIKTREEAALAVVVGK